MNSDRLTSLAWHCLLMKASFKNCTILVLFASVSVASHRGHIWAPGQRHMGSGAPRQRHMGNGAPRHSHMGSGRSQVDKNVQLSNPEAPSMMELMQIDIGPKYKEMEESGKHGLLPKMAA